MTESMDALDKMVLGEATGQMVNGGLEETVTVKLEESVDSKTEEVDSEGGDEISHDHSAANASTATNQELDEKTKDTPKDEVIVTPKKRGADNTNEDYPLKKKRTPSKAKNAKNGDAEVADGAEPVTPKKAATPIKAKKAATVVANEQETTNSNNEGVDPVTPRKKRAPAKPKNSTPNGAIHNTEAEGDGDSTTPKAKVSPSKTKTNGDGTPRKRSAPTAGVVAPSRGIPTSWEEATEADRLLVNMKNDGADWQAIRNAWKQATGQETASSTLPNRYNRIKVNMMRLEEGDDSILLAAKEEIENKFQNEKWALIATEMESKGANKYPTLFIQKKFKELTAKSVANGAGATATEGAADEDEATAEE